jgi:hypothetical protein
MGHSVYFSVGLWVPDLWFSCIVVRGFMGSRITGHCGQLSLGFMGARLMGHCIVVPGLYESDQLEDLVVGGRRIIKLVLIGV